MRLDDWLAHQQAQHPNAIELGLDRVRAVATRLGILPWRIPSVIVGGTNGKGSTVAYLTALARHSGLRVGTYTSPHLQRYNERIAIDGAPILDESLIALFERIEAARHGVALTFFEYGTLAAYLAFIEAKVDIAIIEVGLGGRLDATNIIDADVAVLTSVGLDHMEWLGPTREDIGREKAGIFRAGSPVVSNGKSAPKIHSGTVVFRRSAVVAVHRRPGVDRAKPVSGHSFGRFESAICLPRFPICVGRGHGGALPALWKRRAYPVVARCKQFAAHLVGLDRFALGALRGYCIGLARLRAYGP